MLQTGQPCALQVMQSTPRLTRNLTRLRTLQYLTCRTMLFAALARLALSPAMGDVLVNAGAIGPAVNVLADAVAGAEKQAFAAQLVGRLAVPAGDAAAEKRRQAVLATGAEAPLRALLRHSSHSVQREARAALNVLTGSD